MNRRIKNAPLPQELERQYPKLRAFYGRDEELALLKERLFNKRFVVLMGMGGIGKTQLAVKFLEKYFEGSETVFWYEFKEKCKFDQFLYDLALFLNRFEKNLLVLFSREKDSRKRENLILNSLNKLEYTLFLDDIHLIENEGFDEFFSELERRMKKSICLMIGRKKPNFIPEHKEAEIVIGLRGLRKEDSIKLLMERGLKAQQSQLNEISERLEGHPYALELAARLYEKGRFDVNHPIGEKHSMQELLDGLFDKIYTQLDDDTKRVATAIAVTSKNEVVSQDMLSFVFQNILSGVQLETSLDNLYQCSLIYYENRNISSHSLFRDYFHSRANICDVKELHKRIAQWYIESCKERPLADSALEIYYHLESSGELRNAVEALINFDETFTMQGHCKEFIEELQKTIGKIDDGDLPARIHSSLGKVMTGIHDYDGAINHYDESLRLFQHCGNDKGVAQSFSNLAKIFHEKRKWNEARKNYENSLHIFRKLNDEENIFRIYINLADTWLGEGNLENAKKYVKISQEYFEDSDFEKKPRVYNILASICEEEGDFEKAEEYYDKSMRILDKSENWTMAETCDSLGSMYFRRGNLDKALEYYKECERIFEAIADAYCVGVIWWKLGRIYLMRGNLDQALRYFEESKDRMKLFEDLETYPLFMAEEASVYDKKGDYEQAKSLYSKAKDIAEENRKRNIVTYIEGKIKSSSSIASK
ncbi:MAG: tetratricopeptide repeat protein [Theionarchaea archaeon]|nr:tetratricopeptide repeat protein [Theionarchaea archaeon]